MLVDRLVLDLEPAIGYGAEDPGASIDSARRALVAALARHETRAGRRRDHRIGPTCRAVVNLQSEYRPSSRWTGLEVGSFELGSAPHTKRDLTLQAHAQDGGFNLGLVFDADRLSGALAEEILGRLRDRLRRWISWARSVRGASPGRESAP